jgi:hypothetical protein
VQAEFNFGESRASEIDPLSGWRQERLRQQKELAIRLGLPLGRTVEILLHNGICLRGVLLLREELLLHVEPNQENTRFVIGRVDFKFAEIDRCIRIEDEASSQWREL